jgi:hypothetical protein
MIGNDDDRIGVHYLKIQVAPGHHQVRAAFSGRRGLSRHDRGRAMVVLIEVE